MLLVPIYDLVQDSFKGFLLSLKHQKVTEIQNCESFGYNISKRVTLFEKENV